MPRFYIDCPLTAGARVDLPEALAHHALRTLRLTDGDTLTLFNGQGGEWQARLSAPPGRGARASAELLAFDPREAELSYRVVIAQGLSGGDKMDWTIEKAVELGAAAIQPLACARSVVRLDADRAAKRVRHWQALCESAAAQCGRNRVPAVLAPRALTDWLASVKADLAAAANQANHAHQQALVLVPGARDRLAALPRPPAGTTTLLLIGPEGGLDETELAAAGAAGLRPVSLGPRVLRTETAAAAALATLAAAWGE